MPCSWEPIESTSTPGRVNTCYMPCTIWHIIYVVAGHSKHCTLQMHKHSSLFVFMCFSICWGLATHQQVGKCSRETAAKTRTQTQTGIATNELRVKGAGMWNNILYILYFIHLGAVKHRGADVTPLGNRSINESNSPTFSRLTFFPSRWLSTLCLDICQDISL